MASNKQVFFNILLSVLLGLGLVTPKAFGAAGDLDLGFGEAGRVITLPPGSEGAFPAAAMLQPDGKIVTGGLASFARNGGRNIDFCLIRYLPDGSLDTSFGTDGIVITNFPGGRPEDFTGDGIQDLVLQPDGKILAVGFTVISDNLPISQDPPSGDINFALARYHPDGSLDSSFGNQGLVTLDFSSRNVEDSIHGVALLPDGRILVAGNVDRSATNEEDFALARFLPNGALDPSFGNAGRVQTDLRGGSHDQAQEIALQPDGRILVGGRSGVPAMLASEDFVVLRYNADGTPDNNFGNGGMALANFFPAPATGGDPSEDAAFDLALQPDGKIVLAGTAAIISLPASQIAVARFQADGTPDSSFGTDGLVTSGFEDILSGSLASGSSLLLMASGDLIVGGGAGRIQPTLDVDFALARYSADGSLNGNFGRGGKVVSSFPEIGNGIDSINDLALQADGKIVALGLTPIAVDGNRTLFGFGLTRYLGDSADLSMQKTADREKVTEGEEFSFTLTAGNQGPAVAGGVTVSDELPSTVDFVSASPSQGSCSGSQVIVCNLLTLNPGATATVKLTVRANGSGPLVENSATVSGQVEDENPANNRSTATVQVLASLTLQGGGCQMTPAQQGAPLSILLGFFLPAVMLGLQRRR